MKKYILLLFFINSIILNADDMSRRHGVARESVIKTDKGAQSLQDLSVGDTVSSVSNSTLLLTQGELSHLATYSGEALSVTFDDGETVIVSKNQPFLVNAIGPKVNNICDINDKACLLSQSLTFREAQYLQIGDVLPTQFGDIRRITDIQELKGDYPLKSLTVPFHHTFVLKNGVILHNNKVWCGFDLQCYGFVVSLNAVLDSSEYVCVVTHFMGENPSKRRIKCCCRRDKTETEKREEREREERKREKEERERLKRG